MLTLYFLESGVLTFSKLCFDKSYDVGIIIISSVQMRQKRHKEVGQLAWGFTAGPRWNQHSNSSSQN